MLSVDPSINNSKFQSFFNTIPDRILNTVIDYLNYSKIEAIKLSSRTANDIKDIRYRNGVFTGIECLLKVFATALATKDVGKYDVDNITWELVKWQMDEKSINSSWKNI